MNATSCGRRFVRHRNDAARPCATAIQVISSRQRGFEERPLLSVIIPTADGRRNGYLPALLKQLARQSCQQFEAIIVAGDSRQGRAINTGADIARGQFLLTLDDDTRLLSRETIQRLLDAMQADDAIGMAGFLLSNYKAKKVKTRQNLLIIILLIFSTLLPSAYGTPTVEILMDKTTFRYCEKLFYTIQVSEITGDPAIIHIRDESGKGSSAIPIPISNLQNPIPSVIPFEAEIFPVGKYFIDV